ncbi:MAG TPA: UDP-3-O-acyl-N-acetylglucosamine deacetylase [Thermodesulfovibrionales bacterium]|jgi:UDP-3-O-[3-hydroxymyristoyl] N-acetylglucosamine deacetylase|nr:UDP-3-O-acyl-N-acetylglucosamine deacetylase [Thermodesulfovibrionales bacterium]
MMRLQRTVKQEVSFEGIGLHTGRHSSVCLKPAPRDTGILFVRKDKDSLIKASVNAVTDTAFATTIGYNGAKIRTVEHILAALAGLGIDNTFIEVNGPEIPILDGSSVGLTQLILEAGIAKQSKKRPFIRITTPILLSDGHAEIAALPFEGRRITYRIQFHHHFLGEQKLSIDLTEENFVVEIAPARTFGFLKDVEYLKANGFARGGSFDNAIILGDKGIMNSTVLRFKDEFVRHKILDLIGDLSLLGFPIHGHIIANKSGHTTNLKFLKKLLSCPEYWELESELSQQPVLAYT